VTNFRNLPVSENHRIILDGTETNLYAYDEQTRRRLEWDKLIAGNRYKSQFSFQPQLPEEYF
jgi:hypothetical protein